jgi:hypothetical protein
LALFRFGLTGAPAVPVLQAVGGAEVTLERKGQGAPATAGVRLMPGDSLRVPARGSGTIVYEKEATRIELRENTTLRILDSTPGKRFEVLAGSISLEVAKQPRTRPMTILAGKTQVRVIGTRLTVMAGARATRVGVTQGRVQLLASSDGAPLDVAAGHLAIAQADGTIFLETFAPQQGVIFASDELITSAPAVPATDVPTSPAGVLSSPPTGRGGILREYWFNVAGSSITDLTGAPAYPEAPSGRDYPRSLETVEGGPSHDLYGTRWRGYLHPPITGNYTFWVSSDDTSEFYLSSDDRPESKQLLCSVPGFTWLREWTKYAEQESSLVHLDANRSYYLEILHKESGGGDHVAVGWQPPGSEPEVIGGSYLSPFPIQEASPNR